MDPIRSVTTPNAVGASSGAAGPGAGAATAAPGAADRFAKVLTDAVSEANASQIDAETQVRALSEGKGDLVETMLSLNRAELSLSLVTQVRNRALEAYQEIMRLQV